MSGVNVKFNETRIVDDFRKGTEDEVRYEAGEIYSLAPASAKRWIDRGLAIETSEKPKARRKTAKG